jgi:hypothetical protein
MILKPASAILLLLITVAAYPQQPNSANHSMTIDGVDGPPFPIQTNVRTSAQATFIYGGLANQPFALWQGTIHAGTALVDGGHVDLLLSPPPVNILDGFQDPTFRLDATGAGSFAVQVPNGGSPPNGVPLGLALGEQSIMGDPFNSPYGYSLTAATLVTVVQGPIVHDYSLGDESEQYVGFPNMPIPFYGTSYTGAYVGSNGYVCFGVSLGSDPTSSPQDMLSGPPRIAAQWCDLNCPPNSVRVTVDANPGPGVPGYLRIDYINVQDWLVPIAHDLSILIRTDGYLEIRSAVTNNASHFDQMTGIAPGFGLGGLTQAQKNFTGPQPPGSSVGPGVLSTPPFAYIGGVNEAFYEWFGIVMQNPAYLVAYDNAYDLTGVTLHFLPQGSGGLPGSSNRYVVY